MMQLKKKSRKNGQAFVEFILTLFAFFAVFFMFVKMALGLGVSNYIHYATFMAARSYMAASASERDQKTSAENAFNAYMKSSGGKNRFDGIIKEVGGDDTPSLFIGSTSRVTKRATDARKNTWEEGVTYKFNITLNVLPLFPGGGKNHNQLTLESESWLSREPSEDECKSILQVREKKSAIKGAVFLYDNGC